MNTGEHIREMQREWQEVLRHEEAQTMRHGRRDLLRVDLIWYHRVWTWMFGQRTYVGEPGQRLVTAPLMLSRLLESTYPETFTSLCSSSVSPSPFVSLAPYHIQP